MNICVERGSSSEHRRHDEEDPGAGCRTASVWMESRRAVLPAPLPDAWTDPPGARALLGSSRGARPRYLTALRTSHRAAPRGTSFAVGCAAESPRISVTPLRLYWRCERCGR